MRDTGHFTFSKCSSLSYLVLQRFLNLFFLSLENSWISLPRWLLLSLSNHFVAQIIHMLKFCERTSLVIQWLEVCLAKQRKKRRAPVQSVAWEDPTCRGAAEPMHHNHQRPHAQSRCPPAREATAARSPPSRAKSSLTSLQLEKAHGQRGRPSSVTDK